MKIFFKLCLLLYAFLFINDFSLLAECLEADDEITITTQYNQRDFEQAITIKSKCNQNVYFPEATSLDNVNGIYFTDFNTLQLQAGFDYTLRIHGKLSSNADGSFDVKIAKSDLSETLTIKVKVKYNGDGSNGSDPPISTDGPPEPPYNFSVGPYHTSVTVTWMNGAEYAGKKTVITCNNETQVKDTPLAVAVFSGLVECSVYDVTIYAKNSYGNSDVQKLKFITKGCDNPVDEYLNYSSNLTGQNFHGIATKGIYLRDGFKYVATNNKQLQLDIVKTATYGGYKANESNQEEAIGNNAKLKNHTSEKKNDIMTYEDMICNDIKVYPNPFNDHFKIQSLANIDFSLYNYQGKLIKHGKGNGLININASDLKPGVYILTIVDNQGNSKNYKLVK